MLSSDDSQHNQYHTTRLLKCSKQIDLSFNEQANQSADLNSCFSAIDYIVERGEYVK